MTNFKTSTIFVLTLAFLLSSCGNKKKQNEELEVKKGEIAHIVSDYVYPLPSSFDLMDMLNEIEAGFVIGISNPPSEVEKYTTEAKQSLNLGVYLADLSYASVYRRKQSAQDYLEASEQLIRQLHVDDAIDQSFAKKVTNLIDNKDSLINVVTEGTQNVYSDFHRKGKKDLAYLMVAGAWTEAMYLTLIVSDNTPLNAQIIQAIIYQHKSLIKTITLLEEVKDNAEAQPILTALQSIKNTFDKEDPSALTAEQIEQLTAKTNALRAIIVE